MTPTRPPAPPHHLVTAPTTGEVLQLVCLGACNGGSVQLYDELVHAERRDRFVQTVRSHATAAKASVTLLDLGRRLRHTPHRRLSLTVPRVCVCLECQHARTF